MYILAEKMFLLNWSCQLFFLMDGLHDYKYSLNHKHFTSLDTFILSTLFWLNPIVILLQAILTDDISRFDFYKSIGRFGAARWIAFQQRRYPWFICGLYKILLQNDLLINDNIKSSNQMWKSTFSTFCAS